MCDVCDNLNVFLLIKCAHKRDIMIIKVYAFVKPFETNLG